MISNLLFLNNFEAKKRSDHDKKLADSVICLEVSGKVLNIKHGENYFYKVDLISNGVVIDSLLINQKNGFKFNLAKNRVYGIKITKTGFLPRIISINTDLPDLSAGYFRFQFDTKLIKEKEAENLNKDALDFPIAVISFSNALNCFYYNEDYTSYIKRRMYLGMDQ